MSNPDEMRGVVEVQEPNDRAYFRARLLDIDSNGKKCQVRYLGEGESVWVTLSRLRPLPPPMTPLEMERYAPRDGDMVEVSFCEEGQDMAESWWEGTIQREKGGFYFVQFPDQGETGQTSEVVEKDRLRPAYGQHPIQFDKRNFPIPPHLAADLKATESSLPKVAKLANLIALNISSDGRNLVAIGASQALEMAGALVDMHYHKVPQLAKIAKQAQALQGKMHGVQQTLSTGVVEQFRVDPTQIGMMVGAKGSNIKKVQTMPGVSRVDVRQDGMVNVYADTRESAAAAREKLEIVQDRIPVEANEIGLIIGKQGQQIRELEQISNCRINVENATREIIVVGLRSSVEKARALLTYTIETYKEQRDQEQQIHSLSQELYQLGVPLGAQPFEQAYGYGPMGYQGNVNRGRRGGPGGGVVRGGGVVGRGGGGVLTGPPNGGPGFAPVRGAMRGRGGMAPPVARGGGAAAPVARGGGRGGAVAANGTGGRGGGVAPQQQQGQKAAQAGQQSAPKQAGKSQVEAQGMGAADAVGEQQKQTPQQAQKQAPKQQPQKQQAKAAPAPAASEGKQAPPEADAKPPGDREGPSLRAKLANQGKTAPAAAAGGE